MLGGITPAPQPKDNLSGSGAPTVNDDSADGYSRGSLWLDVTSNPKEAYVCLSNTAGAAVWIQTTLTSAELGSMATQNANAVAVTGGTMSGTDVTVGSGKTLDVSAGTLTLADSQVAWGKVSKSGAAPGDVGAAATSHAHGNLGSDGKFTGDVETTSTGAFYFGDAATNGSWRIVRSGNNLVLERRESGAWVTKTTIEA